MSPSQPATTASSPDPQVEARIEPVNASPLDGPRESPAQWTPSPPRAALNHPRTHIPNFCPILGEVPVWISSVSQCVMTHCTQYANQHKMHEEDVRSHKEMAAFVLAKCEDKNDQDLELKCLTQSDIEQLSSVGMCHTYKSSKPYPRISYTGHLIC